MKFSGRLEYDSGDCGRYPEGFAEMAEALENSKPKIKMTKTPPDSAGLYLRSDSICISDMKVVYVLDYPDAPLPEGIANRGIAKYHGVDACEGTDFYWAKVDESMFEFEGE